MVEMDGWMDGFTAKGWTNGVDQAAAAAARAAPEEIYMAKEQPNTSRDWSLNGKYARINSFGIQPTQQPRSWIGLSRSLDKKTSLFFLFFLFKPPSAGF